MDEDTINEEVLFACHRLFRKLLHIEEIVPCLGRYSLLTSDDRDVLLHPHWTPRMKIDHILNILPRKGRKWFEIFITALTESAEGTGSAHEDLVRALRREKARRVPNLLDQCDPQDDQYQPSKIANQTAWFAEKSNVNHLQAAKAGLASPASPPVLRNHAQDQKIVEDKLREDLQTLQKRELMLKNQVKLLSLNESLILQMKMFRDSLLNVQRFYVERFRNYKLNKASLLSKAQLQIARMIETLGGFNETIDLGKEIEEWDKSLKLMNENYANMKEVLFSLDDSQIERQQIELKLQGEAKVEAVRWIESRQSVVENGGACYDELVKISDIKAESDLISHVKKRIEAGKECLNLWKKWVDLRASL